MCRSTKNVPLQLSNFIRETHIRDGRITLLNSLGEIISSALYSSSVSLSNFLSSDYKMVSCFLHIRPRPRKSATTNQSASLSYKLAGLTAAFRSPQWSDCFPLTWLQRISIQTNANKQNLWMWKKILKLQNIQKQTLDFSIFLSIDGLPKDLLAESEDQLWKKKQTAIRQSNPGPHASESLRSRCIGNKSSTSYTTSSGSTMKSCWIFQLIDPSHPHYWHHHQFTHLIQATRPSMPVHLVLCRANGEGSRRH